MSWWRIMLAHRALYSVTAKPPETASGRSIAITQVMNKWEPLMLHRIVHLRTTGQCSLGLISCTSTPIPEERWKAFITEVLPSIQSRDKLL